MSIPKNVVVDERGCWVCTNVSAHAMRRKLFEKHNGLTGKPLRMICENSKCVLPSHAVLTSRTEIQSISQPMRRAREAQAKAAGEIWR